MAAFKEKKGIDLERMIQSKAEERAEEEAAKAAAAQRAAEAKKVETVSASTPAPTRRTSGSKYKVTKATE